MAANPDVAVGMETLSLINEEESGVVVPCDENPELPGYEYTIVGSFLTNPSAVFLQDDLEDINPKFQVPMVVMDSEDSLLVAVDPKKRHYTGLTIPNSGPKVPLGPHSEA